MSYFYSGRWLLGPLLFSFVFYSIYHCFYFNFATKFSHFIAGNLIFHGGLIIMGVVGQFLKAGFGGALPTLKRKPVWGLRAFYLLVAYF